LINDPLGDMVYVETHQIATNEYGIANLNIGGGTVVTGVFADIAWGSTTHFVKTELDITGNQNYEFIGTSQLLSVPYALYAEKAGNAEDDLDKDPENEIQDLLLTGNKLTITKNGTATEIDLTPYLDDTDKDEQTLTLNGNELSISNGNTINLPPDNDADTLNEIQTISKTNNIITLSKNGGTVTDNDNQTISLNGNELTISNGNTLTLTGAVDLDADPTNELQAVSISNDTIYLSNGGFVILPVNLDNDSTNELQTITQNYNIATLSHNGGYINIDDDDSDPQNEIQSLSITDNNLSISSGNTVTLPSNFNVFFPDGFDNFEPFFLELAWGESYTPPSNKNLYITHIFSDVPGGMSIMVDSTLIAEVYNGLYPQTFGNLPSYSIRTNNSLELPIIVSGSNEVRRSGGSGTDKIWFNGFLIESKVSPITLKLEHNEEYIVPANKKAVIFNIFNRYDGSVYLNNKPLLKSTYNTVSSKQIACPIFLKSGDVLKCNTSSSPGRYYSFNGYLIDN
jgi:hypothetical protein